MATEKQKTAVLDIIENHSTVTEAMKKAGYAKGSIANSSNLTHTKAFKELIAQYGVTDEKLAEVLNRGLDAKKVITSPTEPDREVDDYAVQHKYLETSLRLRGHVQKDQTNNFIQIIKEQRNNYGI